MLRNRLCAALALPLLLAGCGDPPGYRGANLGMTTEQLLSARPDLAEAEEGWSPGRTVFESGPSGDVRNEYYLVKDDALAVIVVVHRPTLGFAELKKQLTAELGGHERRLRLHGALLVGWENWRGDTHLVQTGRGRNITVKLPLAEEIEVAGEETLLVITAEAWN